jgi:hypothetical protein
MLKALSDAKERILVRRSKVIDLYCQGLNETEMSKALNIPRSTIDSDIRVMRQQAKTNIKTFVEEKLPWEHESLMVGVKRVLKKAWDIVNDEYSSEKAVASALHIVMDCYAFKRQLLMDSTYIAPAVRDFIEEQQRELYLPSPQSQRVFGSDASSTIDDPLSQAKF